MSFAFTDILPLDEAKKLLGFLRKPAKGCGWTDWSGEGGVETEIKMTGLGARRLGEIVLPEYISSIFLRLSDPCRINSNGIPESLFIGGEDWVPPCFDSTSRISCSILIPSLNYPINLTYEKNNQMRFSGRAFNTNEGFGLGRVPLQFEEHSYPDIPDSGKLDQWFQDAAVRFSIPGEGSEGFLEGRSDSGKGFYHRYDPEKQDWPRNHYRNILNVLLEESALGYFMLFAVVDIGGMSSFHGESRNVREEAQELLRRIPLKNPTMVFDFTYHVVGPQDWKGREKSRKRWKRAVHQELGTATLENGAVAAASLRIEKEGYVFTLNFDNDDDLIRFPKTKMFQKCKWNSGAE